MAHLKKKKNTQLFFLFDRYCMGGAQRIHLDILNALTDVDKQSYFTRKSPDNAFKEQFYSVPRTFCQDIHFWCDNLLFRLFAIHYLAFYLNRHNNIVLFSSNSTFFYDLLPWVRNKTIRKIELLHNFTFGKNGMEYFGLMNHMYLDNRIVYDNYTLQNIKNQYSQYQIPDQYFNNILFIEPGVEIPDMPVKDFSLPLKLLYAGRGGGQKRIYLLNKIAEICYSNQWPVQFHFAGSMIDEISEATKQQSILYEPIANVEAMYDLYSNVHSIIMTSAYEGFPMLIKEAMACGCIPIVTALPGNKTHLTSMQNSLMIDSINNEAELIKEGLNYIRLLMNDQALTRRLSINAYQYAKKYFSKESFIRSYRNLLINK